MAEQREPSVKQNKLPTTTGDRTGFGVRILNDPNVSTRVQDWIPDPKKEQPQ